MNLRELWDTVVLRDVLGYVLPGLVTLFAIALLVRGFTGMTLPAMITRVAVFAGLGFLDGNQCLAWHPWLMWGATLSSSYVLGHLQTWLTDRLELEGQCWHTGKFALQHLKDNPMALQYYDAATNALPAAHSAGLRKTLSSTEKRRCRAERANRIGMAAAAGNLWRHCDRYAFHKDREIHGMFIGRYYVLALLFTNLGMSSTILGLASLALVLRSCPREALPWILVPLLGALFLVVAIRWLRRKCAEHISAECCTSHWCTLVLAALAVVAVLAMTLPCLEVDACQFLGTCLVLVAAPIAFGLTLVHRSSHYRRRFVERTFPIFYAILQAEERSKRSKA